MTSFLKRHSLILSLCFALLVGMAIFGFLLLKDRVAHINITVGNVPFKVEVADTPLLQEQGLSGHKPLSPNTGMLFVFETPSNYGFWMKDMLFSLDILWMDAQGRVVHIEKNLGPQTYPQSYFPASPSLYVLEIGAGEAERLNIKIGDELVMKTK